MNSSYGFSLIVADDGIELFCWRPGCDGIDIALYDSPVTDLEVINSDALAHKEWAHPN